MVQKRFDQKKRKLIIWISLPFIIALLIVARSAWPTESFFSEALVQLGILCVFLCIIGRCWCILYIGDKKNRRLVDQGPYRYTRNPLYFSTALGTAGLGFMLQSLVLGAVLFAFTYFVFYYVARKEGDDLKRIFGDVYVKYCEQVPAFFPNVFSKVPANDEDQISFSQKALKKTFLDAMLFILLIPIAEILVRLHETGSLPALISLY